MKCVEWLNTRGLFGGQWKTRNITVFFSCQEWSTGKQSKFWVYVYKCSTLSYRECIVEDERVKFLVIMCIMQEKVPKRDSWQQSWDLDFRWGLWNHCCRRNIYYALKKKKVQRLNSSPVWSTRYLPIRRVKITPIHSARKSIFMIGMISQVMITQASVTWASFDMWLFWLEHFENTCNNNCIKICTGSIVA